MPRSITPLQLRKGLVLLGLAIGLILGLDQIAFRLLREGARIGDVARWRYSDWAPRREALARWPKPPGALFVGDSSMARALRPSLLTPEGFNLARTGLRCAELGELSVRMEAMGITAPKLLVVSMLPEQFRPLESDLDFLEQARPSLGSVLRAFHQEPQRSQLAFLPGTRVLRYRLEGWVKGREVNRDIEILSDGTLRFKVSPPATHLHPPMPGFMHSPAGFMDERRAELLRGFVRRWEARGARVIWVKLPLHPDLSGPYRQRHAADFQALDRLLQEVFPDRVIDLSQPLAANLYWDATHLNNEGADRLTEMLRPLLAPHLEATGIPGILAPMHEISAQSPGALR